MPEAIVSLTQQHHPLYDEWLDTWRELGHVYEGDGGYLNGDALLAHPRELRYPVTADGATDTAAVPQEKEKFKRRKRIARYENLAQSLVEIIVDHQYAKAPARHITGAGGGEHPLQAWWENVDGEGTHIDDWLRWHQVLTCVYGHVFVLMDRGPGAVETPTTKAQQGPLVLRVYVPADAPDWIAPWGHLRAVKFVEALERTTLDQALPTEGAYRVRTWDANGWALYDEQGAKVQGDAHGFGVLPVVTWYARRRARIPVIGRSLLGDPKMYRDHYNLVSELRELLRNQTFSLLNIGLGDKETVEEAKQLLGDHAGTDNVVFTRGSMEFVAPPDGPAGVYQSEIVALERRIYRLLGLPWEGDGAAPESGDARRLKAMDLNRKLAGQADEAERLEYGIARLWFLGEYGAEGLAQYAASDLVIRHSDEFYVEQVLQAVEDARAAMSVRLGQTANTEIRKRLVPVVLRDLDAKTREDVEDEITAIGAQEKSEVEMFAAAAEQGVVPGPSPEAMAALMPGAGEAGA